MSSGGSVVTAHGPTALASSAAGSSVVQAGAEIRQTLLGGWFEFFEIDIRALVALRMALGSLLLWDLADRATDLRAHYTDFGVLPRSVLLEKFLTAPWCVCVHLAGGGVAIQFALFVIAAAAAACLLVGYRARAATALSWFLLMSLHSRNPLVLQGGDTLLRMMLFWGMFLPLGRVCSLDHPETSPPGGRRGVNSVAGAALLLQIAFVYWFSAALKSDPIWTTQYSAIYYALSLDHFVTRFGKLLLPYPSLLHVLTFGALWWERLGPVLAFAPVRRLAWLRVFAVTGFWAFHAGMALCLNLGLFPWICCVAWMVFLPPAVWDRLLPAVSPALEWARSRVDSMYSRSRRAVVSTDARDSVPCQILAAIFLVYVLLWNIRTVAPAPLATVFPEEANWLGQLTRVDQLWDMFAPSPLREGGWFVMPAQLRNGKEVDIFRRGAAVTWSKPSHVADDYKNDRWRKYLVVLAEAANTDVRLPYARYLAETWNRGRAPREQVKTMQMYLMMEVTLPGNARSAPKPILLFSYKA